MSLIKTPLRMVKSMFLNIKQIRSDNGVIYINNERQDNFDMSKLKRFINKFLDDESSTPINDKTINLILSDWLSSKELHFYGIYNAEELAGFIAYKLDVKDHPDEAHLRCLYVDDAYRHKGLATQALHKFENAAKLANKTKLHVFVFKDNKPALSLYKKYGFVEDNTNNQTVIEIEL